MLIGAAISGDTNVIKNYIEIIKYKYLTIEILSLNSILLFIIILATGSISVSSRKYPSNINRKHNIKGVQTTAILSTAHILRTALL